MRGRRERKEVGGRVQTPTCVQWTCPGRQQGMALIAVLGQQGALGVSVGSRDLGLGLPVPWGQVPWAQRNVRRWESPFVPLCPLPPVQAASCLIPASSAVRGQQCHVGGLLGPFQDRAADEYLTLSQASPRVPQISQPHAADGRGRVAVLGLSRASRGPVAPSAQCDSHRCVCLLPDPSCGEPLPYTH